MSEMMIKKISCTDQAFHMYSYMWGHQVKVSRQVNNCRLIPFCWSRDCQVQFNVYQNLELSRTKMIYCPQVSFEQDYTVIRSVQEIAQYKYKNQFSLFRRDRLSVLSTAWGLQCFKVKELNKHWLGVTLRLNLLGAIQHLICNWLTGQNTNLVHIIWKNQLRHV